MLKSLVGRADGMWHHADMASQFAYADILPKAEFGDAGDDADVPADTKAEGTAATPSTSFDMSKLRLNHKWSTTEMVQLQNFVNENGGGDYAKVPAAEWRRLARQMRRGEQAVRNRARYHIAGGGGVVQLRTGRYTVEEDKQLVEHWLRHDCEWTSAFSEHTET